MPKKATVIAALAAWTALAAGQVAGARSFAPSDEAHVVSLVNATRAERGLGTVSAHPELTEMARGQAVRMAERGAIFHNPRLGAEATDRGLDWARIGENVGMGPDADTIYAALLASPHHYGNIVERGHTHVGVGIVRAAGVMYLAQAFAALAEPVPSRVSPAAAVGSARPSASPAPDRAPKDEPLSGPERTRSVAAWHPTAVIGGVVAR